MTLQGVEEMLPEKCVLMVGFNGTCREDFWIVGRHFKVQIKVEYIPNIQRTGITAITVLGQCEDLVEQPFMKKQWQ